MLRFQYCFLTYDKNLVLQAENFDIDDESCSGHSVELNRWEPHELIAGKTEEKGGLLRHQRKENILNIIVTCHEKWMLYSKEGGQHPGNHQVWLRDER
ncbi:hypothetical protein TNCT_491891 [Trichonephila clavata]|uniref:Uncharacterized protein n=1 Tax=Trichonephila clavata TaxID=2740835 RepID=A0A8X6JJF6_TRICU|nr:hypothetical protein TNCT_491891 [Trichonephila clavata]